MADLLDDMDDAARALLKAVNGNTVEPTGDTAKTQPPDLKGRIEAFEAVTSYLAVKHKVQPTGAGKSGIDQYRDRINGRASGGRASRKRTAPANGAADTDTADTDD